MPGLAPPVSDERHALREFLAYHQSAYFAVAYGLTGGVYSRAPSHVRAAIHGFRVGNLYINRGITGAMVGRQPFGGFKHSGTGSRAGGPDYLLHFLEPRTVTEAARPTTPHNAGGPS